MIDGVDFYNTIRGTERTPQEYGYNSSDTPHNLSLSGSAALPLGDSVQRHRALPERRAEGGRLVWISTATA